MDVLLWVQKLSFPQDVIVGAGHPAWNAGSYVNSIMHDKLLDQSGQPDEFYFVERLAGSTDGGSRLLNAANLTATTRLVRLFGGTG